MTDTITKPRVSAAAKIVLVLAAAAVLLAVFALAAPGSKFFFPLVSLWCNLALFSCVLLVLRVAGIKFDLFHKAVLVGLWAAALVYFFWALGRRSFVYIWDYVNYINKQYWAEAAFLQGPAAGFQFIFGSFAEEAPENIVVIVVRAESGQSNPASNHDSLSTRPPLEFFTGVNSQRGTITHPIFSENGNTSKMNDSIFTPLGCFGFTIVFCAAS